MINGTLPAAPAVSPTGNMTDILDIKPPVLPPAPFPWIWVLAALALLALGALLAWLWLRRKRRERPPAPPPPPHEVAEKALAWLAAAKDLDDREFAFELSAILRRYIEGRYNFPALEMTVEELTPRLDELDLPGDLGKEIKYLERQAEPVKFAGLRGSDRNRQLEIVRSMVERTKSQPEDETGEPEK